MIQDWRSFKNSTSRIAAKSVPYLGALCFLSTAMTSFTGALIVVVTAAVSFVLLAGLTIALPLSLIWLPKASRPDYLKRFAVCVICLLLTLNARAVTTPIHDLQFQKNWLRYQNVVDTIKSEMATSPGEGKYTGPRESMPPGVARAIPSRTSDGGTLIEFFRPAWHDEGYMYCDTDPNRAIVERSQTFILTKVAPSWYRFSEL